MTKQRVDKAREMARILEMGGRQELHAWRAMLGASRGREIVWGKKESEFLWGEKEVAAGRPGGEKKVERGKKKTHSDGELGARFGLLRLK